MCKQRPDDWRTFQAKETASVKEELRQEVGLPVLAWPWLLLIYLVGLDQAHSRTFLLCHHQGRWCCCRDSAVCLHELLALIPRLKATSRVSHLQWMWARWEAWWMAETHPTSPSPCRTEGLTPRGYEDQQQTTSSDQSYFKSRQFWGTIPCSELLRLPLTSLSFDFSLNSILLPLLPL